MGGGGISPLTYHLPIQVCLKGTLPCEIVPIFKGNSFQKCFKIVFVIALRLPKFCLFSGNDSTSNR